MYCNLQTSLLTFSSSSSSYHSNRSIKAAIDDSNLFPKVHFSNTSSNTTTTTTTPITLQKKLLNSNDDAFRSTTTQTTRNQQTSNTTNVTTTYKLYAILEAVSDRIEMHQNIGQQRDNWNSLLLTSVNMITLAATTLSAVSAAAAADGAPVLPLNLSSALLFSAAAGMSAVMSKLQPSQLTEEQRNASRLFRRVQAKIRTALALRSSPSENDVREAMEEVLALDRAYPLPLLGAMIEKFPERFEPAVWWPEKKKKKSPYRFSDDVKDEMREIREVLRKKDREDYERLGGLALKVNKALAVSGPLLAGVAAASSLFVGFFGGSEWAAVGGGAAASAAISFQHGVQVGMVVEMYRNCAGFFKLMEETIEEVIIDDDDEKERGCDCGEERESGELFRMKMALELGRSLPQMTEIAAKSVIARDNGTAIDEFASKLF